MTAAALWLTPIQMCRHKRLIHMCNTWLISVCMHLNSNRRYLRRCCDWHLFKCLTWLIGMGNTWFVHKCVYIWIGTDEGYGGAVIDTYWNVWHDSLISAPRAWFKYVTWLVQMCTAYLIQIFDMTHSYVVPTMAAAALWLTPFRMSIHMCNTWLIYVCMYLNRYRRWLRWRCGWHRFGVNHRKKCVFTCVNHRTKRWLRRRCGWHRFFRWLTPSAVVDTVSHVYSHVQQMTHLHVSAVVDTVSHVYSRVQQMTHLCLSAVVDTVSHVYSHVQHMTHLCVSAVVDTVPHVYSHVQHMTYLCVSAVVDTVSVSTTETNLYSHVFTCSHVYSPVQHMTHLHVQHMTHLCVCTFE